MNQKITANNTKWPFYCNNPQILLWILHHWGKDSNIHHTEDTTAVLGIVLKRKFHMTL